MLFLQLELLLAHWLIPSRRQSIYPMLRKT
jgi:hypothetical protein